MPPHVSWKLKIGLPLGVCAILAIAGIPGTPSDPHAEEWQPGDIVFLNGNSFRSRLVRLLQGYSTDYSHVGLVVMDAGVPLVVHADPAKGKVISERWDVVTAPGQVSGGALYRLSRVDAAALEAVCTVGRKYVSGSVPFDHDFDLRTEDRLFCTELIWRAYRSAGIDLCRNAETEHPHLLPADLLKSAEVEQVVRF